MWLGIAIMAVGFIGVLVCAKIKNQPLQVGAAVVMLAGLGIYFYAYLTKDNAYARDWIVYRMAVANAVAKELNGAKAVWITGDTESESSKEIQAAFAKAGGNAEYMTVTGEDGMVDAKKFEPILKTLTKDNYLVLDISLMEGNLMKTFATMLKSSNCPKVILTDNASGMDGKSIGIIKAFKDGKIVAAITSNMNAGKTEEFHPDEDDLEEAFNAQYVVVKADNFDQYKANFGYGE